MGGFRELAGRFARDQAHAINADGIHVLVDLSGYTLSPLVDVLGHRPAGGLPLLSYQAIALHLKSQMFLLLVSTQNILTAVNVLTAGVNSCVPHC